MAGVDRLFVRVGRRGEHQWLEIDTWVTSADGRRPCPCDVDDLVEECPELVLGRYLAVAAFDFGPYHPSEAEVALGWGFRPFPLSVGDTQAFHGSSSAAESEWHTDGLTILGRAEQMPWLDANGQLHRSVSNEQPLDGIALSPRVDKMTVIREFLDCSTSTDSECFVLDEPNIVMSALVQPLERFSAYTHPFTVADPHLLLGEDRERAWEYVLAAQGRFWERIESVNAETYIVSAARLTLVTKNATLFEKAKSTLRLVWR